MLIRKVEKRKVHSTFIDCIDSIWTADLADMQSISKFIKGICYYYLLLIQLNTHGLFL